MRCMDVSVCAHLERAAEATVEVCDLEQDQWCRNQAKEYHRCQYEYNAVLDHLCPCFRSVVLGGNGEDAHDPTPLPLLLD